MSATLLLAAAGSRNISYYNDDRGTTLGYRKNKWFQSLSVKEKNEILEKVKHMCECITKDELEEYESDLRIYNKLLEDYNKKSFIGKLFSSKPEMPKKPTPVICDHFYDEGWNRVFYEYTLGYPGN